MKVAAVVVTYQRLAQLQITLTRLVAEEVDHVIVVNNASTDGTSEWLAAQNDPGLHVITLAENMGGAGGFEAGMAYIRDQLEADWIVLMDDDARPAPDALARFRADAPSLDPDIGCVAAAVFYPDGTLCEMNRPTRNPFWDLGLFARTLVKGSQAGFHLPDDAFAPDAGLHDLDVASFVGYFVRRDVILRVGLPEGGLFIYGDDVLYSLRLRRAGFKMVLMPAVQFEHECGTIGHGLTYRPLWKIYYHCRNGVSIARQAAGPVIFPAALGYYMLIWWQRGWHYEADERSLYRRMMWTGLRDGLLHRRGRNPRIHTLGTR